jgi:hypothetical protein
MSRTTRAFHALDFDFEVACDRDALVDYLDDLFDAFPAGTQPAHRYEITTVTEGAARNVATSAGAELGARNSVADLLTVVMQDVNTRAVDSVDALVSHAGGVERDGVGFVFPAHMESGKTTLVTGLVRAGFGYLTDEAVAFDRASTTITPFPKPLSIDPGSWPLFPELAPQPPELAPDATAMQWLVAPQAVRPNALGAPCVARYVVFPRYREGAPTALEPLHRAEAALELAKNTFGFNQESRRGLDSAARVVAGAACYRMTVGTLDAAVALITEVADA